MSAAARAEARLVEPPSRPATWARQAFGTFVAAQKILLDLTAQQNALVIGLIRERVRMPRVHPGRSLAKATRKSVKGASRAGKLLLDLTATESALLAEGVKEGFHLSPATSAVTDILSHRVDTIITMIKRLLDAAAARILSAVDSYLGGKGLSTDESFGEMLRQGILGFVAIEKTFLDLVAEEVSTAVEASKNGRKGGKERAKGVTKLAREAVDEFIDTQKKLLDLAIEQFEEPPEPAEASRPEKRTSLAELTQKSVQNLVMAQKSLLELAVKPIKPAPPVKPAAAKAVRRAPRKRRAA